MIFKLKLLRRCANHASRPTGARGGRRGAIVNVSSDAARTPRKSPITHALAKGTLNVFGKALNDTFGPQGVRVNTVSPGSTRTHLWEGPESFGTELAASAGMDHAEFLDAIPGRVGTITGRMIMPAEVAAVIAYLASPAAESIIGVNYVIDGGRQDRRVHSYRLIRGRRSRRPTRPQRQP